MKVLDEPPFNGFRAAFEAEERLAASLTVVRLNPALASGPYFGLPPDDLAVAVDQAGQALERWTLLAVIVCSEALLFRDANTRVVRKTKDVVRKPLRACMATKRPALGRILDVWRAETKVNQPLASYRELLKVRHWAAHGQRWTLKSSFRGGPWDAWGVVEDLVVALRAHVADFPLDG